MKEEFMTLVVFMLGAQPVSPPSACRQAIKAET